MQLLANGKQQFIDQNGAPLAGGLVYHYLPNTSTLATTYQDQAGQTANPNPITLDSSGQATIWGAGSYRQVVKKSDGTQVWDQVIATPDVNAPLVSLSAQAGAGLVGFARSEQSAVARTVQDKLRERISPEDFGAKGDGVADDTAALNAAINASIKSGGFGTVYLQAGKRYNFTNLSIDGVIGLTIKGQNGGNVGNLSPGSSGGASMLVCTSTTGDALAFTGVAYHAAQITFEDVALYANTTGYALTFNNVSQINFKRMTVTNAGGATYAQGHGLRFSNCYYVHAEQLYIWKSGSLYTVGCGITVDRGSQTSFLGGLFNFNNCSIYGFQTAAIVGDQDANTTINEGFANFNYTNGELNSNGQGLCFYYGVTTAVVRGNYIEGNLQLGVGVYDRASTVTIEENFFNNSTASVADIQLGMSGVGGGYPIFANVEIRNNTISGVNKYGVISYAGAGSGVSVCGNKFTLATAGAVGVSLGEAAAGNLAATVERNSFYGFAAGSARQGACTEGKNNYEFDANGNLTAATKHAAVVYPAFADFTQIAPNDPETSVLTNTTASARYINGTVVKNRYRRQHITLTAASTQSVRLMASDSTTTLATLAPGKSAFLWNDGTNEYASLLP